MTIGSRTHPSYNLNGTTLLPVDKVKDLGVMTQSNLKTLSHTLAARKSGLRTLWWFRRTFDIWTPEMFHKLYTTFIRPVMEFGASAYFPCTKGEELLLEGFQRLGTRLVSQLRNLPYQERCEFLRLTSTSLRRLRRRWRPSLSSCQLDWRPFYDTLYLVNESAEAEWSAWFGKNRALLHDLLETCNRYFPFASIDEIWREIGYQVVANASSNSKSFFEPLLLYTPFFHTTFDTINSTWLQTIFQLWYNGSSYDSAFNHYIDLLSRISRGCRGLLDWEPHLERIFTGLIRYVTLFEDSDGELFISDPEYLKHYAVLIVNTIDHRESNTTLQRIGQFYKAVEPLCHPGNVTNTTNNIACFTNALLTAFSQRLQGELNTSPEFTKYIGIAPVETYLTVSQVDQLVDLLLPLVADYLLFCEGEGASKNVMLCLTAITRLRPRRLMPRLLASIDDGMACPESPLRYKHALLALKSTVNSLLFTTFPFFRATDDQGWDWLEYGGSDLTRFANANGMELVESWTSRQQQEKDELVEPSVKFDSSIPDQVMAHLPSLLYPEGRCELVRVFNMILPSFDSNFGECMEPAMKCLGRLLPILPLVDYSEHESQSINPDQPPIVSQTIAHSTDGLEDCGIRLFDALFDCLASLNGSQHSTTTASSHTTDWADTEKHRPFSSDALSRSSTEVNRLTHLSGLATALAIAASPSPRLRCRLLQRLTNSLFDQQWDPDTSRLLAIQAHWLAINSKAVASQQTVGKTGGHRNDDACSFSIDNTDCDTSLIAWKLVWPRFVQLFDQLDKDDCLANRNRTDPQLVTLLYALPGYLSALDPDQLVESTFSANYTQPLINMLSRMLYISTGGVVGLPATNICPSADHQMTFTPCTRLAEAASSLLAVLIHRLSACSIRLSQLDLMQIEGRNSPFLTSPYWTPFVYFSDFLSQTLSPTTNTSTRLFDTNFWFQPTETTTWSLVNRLISQFLLPLLSQLDRIALNLSKPAACTNLGLSLSCNLTVSQQRDQLTTMITWLHNAFNALGDCLAPRQLNDSSLPPSLGIQFLHYQVESDHESVGLREHVLQVTTRLLTSMTELIRVTDDTLVGWSEKPTSSSSSNLVKATDAPTPPKPSDSPWLWFHAGQLRDLLDIAQRATFNLTSRHESTPLLLLCYGPTMLDSANFGSFCLLANQGALKSDAVVCIVPPVSHFFGNSSLSSGPEQSPLHLSRSNAVARCGRTVLGYLAKLGTKYRHLLAFTLRPLYATNCGSSSSSFGLTNTPSVRRLMHLMFQLTVCTRRSQVSDLTAHMLEDFAIGSVDGLYVQFINKTINRLESANETVQSQLTSLIEQSNPLSSKLPDDLTLLKLVNHHKHSSIQFMITLFLQTAKSMPILQLRRNLQPYANLCLALAVNALNESFPKICTADQMSKDDTQSSSDSQLQRHFRNVQHDLELDLTWLFEQIKFSLPFCFSFEPNPSVVAKSTWLKAVYSETYNLVSEFGNYIEINTLNESSSLSFVSQNSEIVGKSRSVYRHFLLDMFNKVFLYYKQEQQTQQDSRNESDPSIGSALLSSLLGFLPSIYDMPLSPSWQPNLVPPNRAPPPPPSMLVETVCQLVTSRQTDVCRAAMNLVIVWLQTLLIFQQPVPIKKVDMYRLVTDKSGGNHLCPVQISDRRMLLTIRPDNAWLQFDEKARVLLSDKAYEQYHHVGEEEETGIWSYPPQMYISELTFQPAYPSFDPVTGKLAVNQSDGWLSFLAKAYPIDGYSDDELLEAEASLRTLAQCLASPSSETRQLWLTLASRLLYIHSGTSSSDASLPPLSDFVYSCCLAFGPLPLLDHLEAMMHQLLVARPSESPQQHAGNGVVEFIGPLWLQLVATGLFGASSSWPRQWRLHALGNVLPRIAVSLEYASLSVKPSRMVGSEVEKLPLSMLSNLNFLLTYAVEYAGDGDTLDYDFDEPEGRESPISMDDADSDADDSTGSELQSILDDLQMNVDQTESSPPPTVNLNNTNDTRPSDKSILSSTTPVTSSQAGGHLLRPRSFYTYLSDCIDDSYCHDVNLWHPIWDWAWIGIEDCLNEEESGSSSTSCSHPTKLGWPVNPNSSQFDKCSLCLANKFLPRRHRFIFLVKFLLQFTFYACQRGYKMAPLVVSRLNSVFSRLGDSSSESCAVDSWTAMAYNNSIWLRDLSAYYAVYRVGLGCCNEFYQLRLPGRRLRLTGDEESTEDEQQPVSFIENDDYLYETLQGGLSKQKAGPMFGALFVFETYLPRLVRDTVAVLRLKGCTLSSPTTRLLDDVLAKHHDLDVKLYPDWLLPSASSSANGNGTHEQARRKFMLPLTNRLQCMFTCLPSIISVTLPIALEPNHKSPRAVTSLSIPLYLAPLLADLCSVGSFYRELSESVSFDLFSTSGFGKRRLLDETNDDEPLDGLENGAFLLLDHLARLPLGGQGATTFDYCRAFFAVFFEHTSWKSRGVGLVLLRKTLIVNLPSYMEPPSDYITFLTNQVEARLVDDRAEVSDLAMQTLAGMVQIGIVKYDQDKLDSLIRSANRPLPPAPSNHGDKSRQDDDHQAKVTAYRQAIQSRHSDLLKLCAVVTAHPNTTPSFLPEILSQLANHVYDPLPIRTTVSDALNTYAKSHHGINWPQHECMFSEQQLDNYLSAVRLAPYYI